MESSSEYFRQNLLRLRTRSNNGKPSLTQTELAKEAGVHRNYVGMLERGERRPSLEMVDALARVLEVQPHELLMPPDDRA